jgi:hypothetical protein
LNPVWLSLHPIKGERTTRSPRADIIRHVDWPAGRIVRHAHDPADGLAFLAGDYLDRRTLERIAHLGQRNCVAHFGPAWRAFAVHIDWTGGWANILIALALGAILAGFYLWRRDLVANMIGHFLVDFAANISPALFHGKS